MVAVKKIEIILVFSARRCQASLRAASRSAALRCTSGGANVLWFSFNVALFLGACFWTGVPARPLGGRWCAPRFSVCSRKAGAPRKGQFCCPQNCLLASPVSAGFCYSQTKICGIPCSLCGALKRRAPNPACALANASGNLLPCFVS